MKKHPEAVEFVQCLRCFKAVKTKEELTTHECDLVSFLLAKDKLKYALRIVVFMHELICPLISLACLSPENPLKPPAGFFPEEESSWRFEGVLQFFPDKLNQYDNHLQIQSSPQRVWLVP